MEKDIKATVPHILALKVMKLTKPTLACPIVVTSDSKDLPNNIFNNELKKDITAVPGSETITASQFLLIPQSFGNIYLGETFSSYIFVHNDSNEIAKNVTVKADLQTSSTTRIALLGYQSDVQAVELAPGNTVDQVIHHEVKDVGQHMLICEVGYTRSTGEKQMFKKFFKFQVWKPLDLKTKFYNAESDEVFLEAQVLNLTTEPIHLERVSLESSPLFKAKSLNSPEEEKRGGSLLQPDCSRQYLYCLAPTESSSGSALEATNIGKLDIVWRSNLGGRGRLQTSQLPRVAPDYGDIRLTVFKLPNIVKLEEPFSFSCKVFNLSMRSMELTFGLEKMHSGLAWIGLSGRNLGTLAPGNSIQLELTMVPLASGLHNISGIRLKDNLLNRPYDYDDVAQVFVT